MYQPSITYDNSFAMTQSSPTPTLWNHSENKLFEESLVLFPEESPDRWQNIASQLPGKSALEVREHYEALIHDLFEIESGRVELPIYADDSDYDSPSQISFVRKTKHREPERKKGMPWTEEEHKLFLIGLKKFGKGDWRSISRNVVVTRTPTQVASHAQKYFLRQAGLKKERKRSSIHDITTVDNPSFGPPVDQNWIYSSGGTGTQQPPALQQFPPPGQFAGQGDSLDYQNYGFPM